MNKNNLYILGAIIFILILLGALGAYKFRREIKAAIMPQNAPTTSTTENTTPSTPEATPPVDTAPTASSPSATQSATEVDYTDSGFSPATITIKVGDSVKFVNKTNSPMWVASNPHPTHTDLPGFDEKNSDPEFTYTFTKIGSWGYHNHRNPSDGGTVVVTE